MSKVFAFLADGLEEVECLAVVDVLRRAGAEVTLVSVTGSREITGSHHIHFQADALFDETAAEEADVLFLPGGMEDYRKGIGKRKECDLQGKQAGAPHCSHLRSSKYPWGNGTVKGKNSHLLSRF